MNEADTRLLVEWRKISHGPGIGRLSVDRMDIAQLVDLIDRSLKPLEAIRQTVDCPTCDGAQHLGPATGAKQADYGRACPDCTDGKIDMAHLLAVGAAVFTADLHDFGPIGRTTIEELRSVEP